MILQAGRALAGTARGAVSVEGCVELLRHMFIGMEFALVS